MLLESVGGKFTLATTLKVCIQVLAIIQEIHNRGVVLRYLKPGNMVIGKGENKDYIYLIDFEIAKNYIKNGTHIPYTENKKIKGNPDYISLNTQLGKEISRRDDIECLGYNLIYFMKGKLPWSHMRKNYEILQKKIDISLDELCEGLPEEFKEFIKYSRELEFTEEPDYNYLNGLLKKVAEKNGIDIDKTKYDWDIKTEEKLLEKKKEKENKTEENKKKEEYEGVSKKREEIIEKGNEGEVKDGKREENSEKEEESSKKENEIIKEDNEKEDVNEKRKEKEEKNEVSLEEKKDKEDNSKNDNIQKSF